MGSLLIKDRRLKVLFLAAFVALTLAIHYGFVLEPLFGHAKWVHSIHGRFCYIPIAISAIWFGVTGGLLTALSISILVLPYIFLQTHHAVNLSGEIVEIVFYFAIALLTGALTSRELKIRRKKEIMELQLERAKRLSSMGQMAAGVAHEIKNPLASIKGAVEILADSSTAEIDKLEFSDIAIKEIKRVDGTVRDFLSFARPKEMRFESLDVSDTVKSIVRQVESQASKRGIRITAEVEDNLTIEADREGVHQVLLNLALNAIEASTDSSEVVVTLSSPDADSIEISFSDSGEGMTAEEAEKIFEPFYTTKSSGTGLGLAVSKSIVDAHRGSINVISKPGEGTELLVTLPVRKDR